MPTSAEPATCLVDTSAAVALLVADHAAHLTTSAALRGLRLGLAGHAAFETYSVLSRLPSPARRRPAVIAHLLATELPATTFPSPASCTSLLAGLPELGIAGGAVYDALIGLAATSAALPLASRDRRALPTYRALGVLVELLPE